MLIDLTVNWLIIIIIILMWNVKWLWHPAVTCFVWVKETNVGRTINHFDGYERLNVDLWTRRWEDGGFNVDCGEVESEPTAVSPVVESASLWCVQV